MRKIFQATGYSYGLSATLPQSELLQRSFDIDRMQHTVDWFNVKTYDIDVGKRDGRPPFSSSTPVLTI